MVPSPSECTSPSSIATQPPLELAALVVDRGHQLGPGHEQVDERAVVQQSIGASDRVRRAAVNLERASFTQP